MKKKAQNYRRTLLLRGSFLSLVIFCGGTAYILTGTRPETIGLPGVVGFFLMVYGVFTSLLLFFLAVRKRSEPIRFRSVLKVAVLALAPVMLLALNSTNPVGPLDVLLVVAFEAAAIFYVDRIA